MKISRQLLFFIFFLLLILFVGMLFWPFILHEVIIPVSQAVWLLIRIFVLSIDQKYYWIAIILVAVFILLIRQIFINQTFAIVTEKIPDSNATLRTVDKWQSLFSMNDEINEEEKILKRELVHLLLSLYSIKQRTEADYQLFDALEQGEIPLPAYIHTYLFEKSENNDRPFIKRLKIIGNLPGKWMRHWSGQDKVEHYQMIDDVLDFIETSLEMKNDE